MQDLIKEYQVTADELEGRIKELTRQREQARGSDALLLEKRLEIIQEEYWDICDAIKEMASGANSTWDRKTAHFEKAESNSVTV